MKNKLAALIGAAVLVLAGAGPAGAMTGVHAGGQWVTCRDYYFAGIPGSAYQQGRYTLKRVHARDAYRTAVRDETSMPVVWVCNSSV